MVETPSSSEEKISKSPNYQKSPNFNSSSSKLSDWNLRRITYSFYLKFLRSEDQTISRCRCLIRSSPRALSRVLSVKRF
ncbi:hypothetical protein L1987_51195 [Smallanthus sonchifolius]|uniref:Uncharacterized protein n=1 Tax=Smallanthus sonchifolius TaxID=185202 RepID=A0ACB9EQR7_9ASTR|nr:hypothetical protein L1987_51195 [Smallanthus sonchifolius]